MHRMCNNYVTYEHSLTPLGGKINHHHIGADGIRILMILLQAHKTDSFAIQFTSFSEWFENIVSFDTKCLENDYND